MRRRLSLIHDNTTTQQHNVDPCSNTVWHKVVSKSNIQCVFVLLHLSGVEINSTQRSTSTSLTLRTARTSHEIFWYLNNCPQRVFLKYILLQHKHNVNKLSSYIMHTAAYNILLYTYTVYNRDRLEVLVCILSIWVKYSTPVSVLRSGILYWNEYPKPILDCKYKHISLLYTGVGLCTKTPHLD